MERFEITLPAEPAGEARQTALAGVVSSGNLEVLVETGVNPTTCTIEVSTSAHGFRDIVSSHRLEKHRWQAHYVAVRGNVGEALEKFEKLCRLDDREGNRGCLDELLLSDLRTKVAAIG